MRRFAGERHHEKKAAFASEIYDINERDTAIGGKEGTNNVAFEELPREFTHCRVLCKDGGHWIQDQGSAHGTYLFLSDSHNSRHEYMVSHASKQGSAIHRKRRPEILCAQRCSRYSRQ